MKSADQSLKYKIVEHRAENMNLFWKCSIITLMAFLLTSTCLTMFGFRSLVSSFHSKCFINAILHFNGGNPGNITKDSIWGSYIVCDYFNCSPLIIGVFAMFWLVMFALCGRGGYDSHQKFFIKPWQIVIPSLVFFATMAIIQTAYTSVLSYYLTKFCTQLEENFGQTLGQAQMNCGYLIGFYSSTPQESFVPTAMNYHLTLVSSRATLLLWIIATIIMLLRMIIGADFDFVLVPASNISASYNKLSETSQSLSDNSKVHLIYMGHRHSLTSRKSLHFMDLNLND